MSPDTPTDVDDVHRWTVPEAADGERLDRHVATHLDRPRNQVRQWIEQGAVRVGGRHPKPSSPVTAGDAIECEPPQKPVDVRVVPEEGPLRILHADDDVVVLDKSAGVAVHPGAGRDRGTLVNFLLHRFPDITGVGGAGRPGIVHRLDLDTTGAMVIARSERAYRRLSEAFAERRVDKRYQAIAYGVPQETEGTIDLPIGRHRQDRKRMAVRQDGRPALTHYVCRRSARGIAHFELDLETGRTHQIRVHLKAIHHPLVGDPVYGEARWRALPKKQRRVFETFPRPALHAWRLGFDHPADGRPMTFEAPVPGDMRTLWEKATGEPWALE